HPAGRVRDVADALLGHLVATGAGLVPDVLLGHDPADGPGAGSVLAAGHLPADRDLYRGADRLADVPALLDHPALDVWHPHLLAHRLAGALHALLDERPGAVVAGAGAGVEHAGAGHPHAAGDHRPGDVLADRLEVAGAHLHDPLGDDGLLHVVDPLLGAVVHDGVVGGHRRVVRVRLVHRLVNG